jgi:hypothetical protein
MGKEPLEKVGFAGLDAIGAAHLLSLGFALRAVLPAFLFIPPPHMRRLHICAYTPMYADYHYGKRREYE